MLMFGLLKQGPPLPVSQGAFSKFGSASRWLTVGL